MKIIRISTTVSKMPNEEIRAKLIGNIPVNKAIPLINEAFKRNDMECFFTIASNYHYSNHPTISKLIWNIMERNPQYPYNWNIVTAFLNSFSWNNSAEYTVLKPKMLSLSLVNPKITSAIILHSQIPADLTDSIFNNLPLGDPRKTTLENSPHLQSILEDLKSGISWGNQRAGLIMTTRIVRSPQDRFVTEVSKYNLEPGFALAIINIGKTYKNQNPELSKNIKGNKNLGIQIAHFATLIPTSNPQIIIPSLIDIIKSKDYDNNKQWMDLVWNSVFEKMKDPSWMTSLFTITYTGEDVISTIIDHRPDFIPNIIDSIKQSPNIADIISSKAFKKLIETSFQNTQYKNKILELPEEYFDMIDLSPINRSIVQEHFNPIIEDYENLKELLGTKTNWYVKYAEVQKLLKEAGWFNNLSPRQQSFVITLISILSSISAVFEAGAIRKFLDSKNIPEAQQQALVQTVNQLTYQQKNIEQLTSQDIAMAKQKLDEVTNKALHQKVDRTVQKIQTTKEQSIEAGELDIEAAKDSIRKHEGKSNKVYLDPSKKNWCVGYGFNLNKPNSKFIIQSIGADYNRVLSGQQILTDNQIEKLLDISVKEAISIAEDFTINYNELPSKAKLVLVNMAFMGRGTLNEFKDLKNSLSNNDYNKAADDMLDSLWAKQVGRRATELADIMRSLT